MKIGAPHARGADLRTSEDEASSSLLGGGRPHVRSVDRLADSGGHSGSGQILGDPDRVAVHDPIERTWR